MVRKSARNAKAAAQAEADVDAETVTVETTRVEKTTVAAKTKGKKAVVSETKVETKVETEDADVKKTTSKRKPPTAAEDEDPEDDDAAADEKKPAPKKRKTRGANKGEEDMPLATRTAVSSLKRAMYIGAHVSGAGGVQNAIQNAQNIGANSFALFLKSQRKWTSPPLANDAKDAFLSMLKQHNYDAAQQILPHGSYLVNLAQADNTKADQAYNNFVDDLQRCEALGIKLYNFHPGSTGGASMEEATGRIAAQLNKSHKATKSVITVVENMCGSGNVVGSKFEELRDIIEKVEDKSRVGVCIDTCHSFAAGYDLRTPQAFKETMEQFDKIVGLKYLKALHLNDSKAPIASNRDLHANIGTGFLGLEAFHNIMNYEPFQNIPMVLETPIDEKGADGKAIENKQIWADEIKLLESLIGADMSSPALQGKAKELQAKGASERNKIQEQVDKKADKDAKKADKGAKGKGASKKKKKDETDDESD